MWLSNGARRGNGSELDERARGHVSSAMRGGSTCLFGLFVVLFIFASTLPFLPSRRRWAASEARPDHVRNAQPGAGGRYGNLAMPAITVGEEGVGVGARAKGLIAAFWTPRVLRQLLAADRGWLQIRPTAFALYTGGGDRDPGKYPVWLIRTRRICFWPPLSAPHGTRSVIFFARVTARDLRRWLS